MEILLYLVFLAVGFSGGALFGHALWARRLDRLADVQDRECHTPRVEVKVSEELVARYLATFDLVAVPRNLVEEMRDASATRH